MKASISVATASALLCVASASAETLYTVTPIGSLPGATWTEFIDPLAVVKQEA